MKEGDWLHVWRASIPAAEVLVDGVNQAGMNGFLLDARSMQTTTRMLVQVGVDLGFPDYYGVNWAAFDECITDMSWSTGFGFVLLFTEARHLLALESQDQFELLIKILGRAAKEWLKPVLEGEVWDRSSRPFHVVFQDDSAGIMNLEERLRMVPHVKHWEELL